MKMFFPNFLVHNFVTQLKLNFAFYWTFKKLLNYFYAKIFNFFLDLRNLWLAYLCIIYIPILKIFWTLKWVKPFISFSIFSVSAQLLVMVNTIVTPISHVPWTQKTFDGYSMTAATLSKGCTSTNMNCCDGTRPSLDSFSVQPLHAARVGLVILKQNTASIWWHRPLFASFDTTPLCCIIPSAKH